MSSYELDNIIVCAANKFKDGVIIIGVRHWDKFMHQQADALEYRDGKKPLEHEQGFIDQYGTFYTRDEALELVKKNGQQLKRPYDEYETLYSENLY